MRFSKIEPRQCAWCRETYDARVTYAGYAANGGYCDTCRDGCGPWEVQPRTIIGLTPGARARLAAWVRRDNAGGPGECAPAGAHCERTTLDDGRTRLTWPSGEATFNASADPKAVEAFIARLEKGAKDKRTPLASVGPSGDTIRANASAPPARPASRVLPPEGATAPNAPRAVSGDPNTIPLPRRAASDTRIARGLCVPTDRRSSTGATRIILERKAA